MGAVEHDDGSRGDPTAGLSDEFDLFGIADLLHITSVYGVVQVLHALLMASKRLYYEHPVPYGGWALSLIVLLRVFFWFKGEDAASTGGSAGEAEPTTQGDGGSQSDGETAGEHWRGESAGGARRSWVHTSSSAYQTDEEVYLL